MSAMTTLTDLDRLSRALARSTGRTFDVDRDPSDADLVRITSTADRLVALRPDSPYDAGERGVIDPDSGDSFYTAVRDVPADRRIFMTDEDRSLVRSTLRAAGVDANATASYRFVEMKADDVSRAADAL